MSGGNLVTAMDEMKLILATPIKAYPEDELSPPPYDDIPTQFTRLLGKGKTSWDSMFVTNIEHLFILE